MATSAQSNTKTARRTGRDGADHHKARQREARALGDPTRYQIFRYVMEAEGPVGVAAITSHLGLHHNAVRQHLAKLCAAQLLVEEVGRRSGPGRPPLVYRVAPGAAGSWGSGGPYELLSLLLLQLAAAAGEVGDGDVASTAVAAGRLAVTPLPERSSADPVESLLEVLAQQGSQPQQLSKGRRTIEIALRRCPFEVAALADPKLVCELHRGLAQGMVEGLGAQLQLTGLVTRDPRDGDCRLRLRPT